MKIAILSIFPPYRGGIAHFNVKLYETLSQRHQVSVINFSRQYPNLFFPGKSQLDSDYRENNSFDKRIIDSINPVSWIKAYKVLKNQNPDLIIYKYWMPFFAPCLGSISFLFRKYLKGKSLAIIDNLIPHEKRFGDKLLNKFFLKQTDYFIVMSGQVEKELIYLKPKAKYSLLQHPIYNNFGEKISQKIAKEKLGIKETKVILYFGFIRKYKGVKYLIRAVPGILKKIDARIILAGEFYDDKSSYTDEIKKTNCSNKITVQDSFIPDSKVHLYFSAADLVVLPYVSATQSGIVKIAMNYDLPCVVTNVGGLPEIISDGKTGFVIEPKSERAISETVLKYFLETNQEKMIKNIKDNKRKYSWENFTQKTINLVNDGF